MEEVKDTDIRFVKFHYLIINNTEYRYFVPIKREVASGENAEYCSEICTYIGNKRIPSWFSIDTRWSGILEPDDSIHAELKISQWMLDSAKVNTKIALEELANIILVKYCKCPSDTMFSSIPIPQLTVTYNDTIAMHYKEESNLLDRHILCP